jgi:predicted transcriptional regulator
MKQQTEITVRLSEELLRKMEVIAAAENRTLNNHILFIMRQNLAYYEKVHGKIKLPPENAAENK